MWQTFLSLLYKDSFSFSLHFDLYAHHRQRTFRLLNTSSKVGTWEVSTCHRPVLLNWIDLVSPCQKQTWLVSRVSLQDVIQSEINDSTYWKIKNGEKLSVYCLCGSTLYTVNIQSVKARQLNLMSLTFLICTIDSMCCTKFWLSCNISTVGLVN